MVRTNCHTFDPLFSPPISAQNPCFYQKLSPKVLFFSHCTEFWNFFMQRPLIGCNLRKRYPNAPSLWLLSLKEPLFFALHLRGMLLPQTRSEAGKFCFLETESCNLVNTFRCEFNKGDENKISVLQAQPTQLCIMDEFHWRAGMIHRPLSPIKHERGYILQPPSINLHTWLSKQMSSVPEAVRAEAF